MRSVVSSKCYRQQERAPKQRKQALAVGSGTDSTSSIRGELGIIIDHDWMPGVLKMLKSSSMRVCVHRVQCRSTCEKCPRTMAALASVPVMSGCSLGYVFFSVLSPGTRIEPHCGASNLRLRCHLPLQLPTAGRAGALLSRTCTQKHSSLARVFCCSTPNDSLSLTWLYSRALCAPAV